MTDAERLILLSDRIARLVSSVDGVVSREEVETLAALERKIGARWDAVNRRWQPLEPE